MQPPGLRSLQLWFAEVALHDRTSLHTTCRATMLHCLYACNRLRQSVSHFVHAAQQHVTEQHHTMGTHGSQKVSALRGPSAAAPRSAGS